MKISVEGLLGSARKLNNQRNDKSSSTNKNGGLSKTDIVSISTKATARVDNIDNEFKGIQSSLTKNQIISDGIKQIQKNIDSGETNHSEVLSSVRFQGEPALMDFIGDNITPEIIKEKAEEVNSFLVKDETSLKKMQVELENIMASELVDDKKASGILDNVEKVVSDNVGNLGNITSLQPDAVLRLIS